MHFIPGLLSLLTFPGVIAHEIAHLLFCRLYGVRVLKVCYFRFGNPAGYVLHEQPRQAWKQIPISLGPFFVNTLLGLGIAWTLALHPERWGDAALLWPNLLQAWLGIAIAMHAFPSTGDAKALWAVCWSKGTPILLKLVSIPLVLAIYLISLGSVIWLNAIFAVVVTLYLPRWLVGG